MLNLSYYGGLSNIALRQDQIIYLRGDKRIFPSCLGLSYKSPEKKK